MSIYWIVEPYIPIGDPFKYIADIIPGYEDDFDFRRNEFFSFELTNFTGYNNGRANITTTLIIKPFHVNNGTIITCEIDISFSYFATLYLAGTWNHFLYRFSNVHILRCTPFHKRSNHIPREGDIFHSCTRARRYV